MGSYMIPRNTKGEGKILFIFSTKALIYTVAGGIIGLLIRYVLKLIGLGIIGTILTIVLALIGFIIATFKVPNTESFKFTRLVGGENIDEIILRYIKFKKKKNKIYITKEEE